MTSRASLVLIGSRATRVLLLALAVTACSKPSVDQLMASARRHLAENNLAAAQIELRNALQAAPGNGEAHRLLGAVRLRQGDPAAAELILRKALTLAQSPEDVSPHLALALLRQGKAQQVIDEFGSSTLKEPAAHAALRASVGHAWLLRGEVKPAADAFASALAMQPGQAAAVFGQARIAAHENKLDDAMALNDTALKNDGLLVEAHVFKSQLLMAKGERAAALDSLEKALTIDPTYVTARAALAAALIDAKDHDKAKAVLGAAGPASQHPRLLFLQSVLALRQGDLGKARDFVAAVLKEAPDHGAALALAGEVELRAGNPVLAEQHLSRAMRAEATAGVRRLLATAQLRQNRPGKALETLRPLLQESGTKDVGLLLLAGEAFLANGDLRRAGELFEAAKTADANAATVRTRLGQLALKRGDIERGEQELLAASAIGTHTIEPELLLVSWHLRRQEAAKALAAAQTLIKKAPQNPLGHVLAGAAYAIQRDRAAARQSFETALKLKGDHVPALRALADLDVDEGKQADAQKRYDALLAKKPDDEQLLLSLASLQERTGRADEAAKTLRKAVAAHPRALDPAVALVQYHLRRKDPAAALDVAQNAIRNNPDELNLALLLGTAQEAAGAGKDALRTLSALVLKEPNAVAAMARLAQLQVRQRDFDGAATTLSRAYEKAPQNDTIARDLAAVYLQAGQADRALKVAKHVQARSPESSAGHLLEGDVRAHARQWAEAEHAYRAALKFEPHAAAVAGKLYRALNEAGKKKEANDFATNWVAQHPADVSMRMLAAERALRARQFTLAIQLYEETLRINPNHPVALNNLAWAYGQTQNSKAIATAERAASLAPNSPDVLDTLGTLHLKQGDANKGLEALQRARGLAPERPDLRFNYAKGLLQNGRKAEGHAELRELATAKADFPGKADIPALLAAQ